MNKKPFNFLDAYQEVSFNWAENVWNKISSRFDSGSVDMEMMAISLAKIYSDFLYVSMGYKDDFRDYLLELYGRNFFSEKWELMNSYREKVYDAMLLEYGEDYKIYESLEKSVLVQDEYEDNVYNCPSQYREEDAFTFVMNGFLY